MFFKLMLVSRLKNLVSDRRLVEHCSLRLDMLYFLGYEVDEYLPWHSTISRTRQLFPAAVFEHLFNHVFAQCVAASLVTGHTQAVDSAFVKGNASLKSLCEKQAANASTLHVAGEPVPDVPLPAPAALLSSPAHQLQRFASTHTRYLRNTSGPLGRGHPQARLLSNKTHYSPADPDARMSVKPGKARALNYLCSMAVDEGHGAISHVQADFADQRDCTLLPSIVAPLRQWRTAHELLLREVAADTSYSNGLNYALLEAQGITPRVRSSAATSPKSKAFPTTRKRIALLARQVSCCRSNASIPTRMARYLVPCSGS